MLGEVWLPHSAAPSSAFVVCGRPFNGNTFFACRHLTPSQKREARAGDSVGGSRDVPLLTAHGKPRGAWAGFGSMAGCLLQEQRVVPVENARQHTNKHWGSLEAACISYIYNYSNS